jgi:hypothetical protein
MNASGLGVAVAVIVPVDDPEVPDVTVIHDASADAVQEHPAALVVTVTANEPPSTGTDCVAGVTLKVHGVGDGGGAGVPACVTITCALPPVHWTVIVPVRDAVPGLGDATEVRLPVSVPVEAPLNVSQLASDEAVHVQLPEALVTVTAKEPPPAAAACVAAERLYPHAVGVVVPPLLLLQPAAAKTATRLNTRQSFMICSPPVPIRWV